MHLVLPADALHSGWRIRTCAAPAEIVEEVGMVVRCHGKGTLALYARS